jgi:filamentous hemagglutinin family protein
MRFFSRLNRKKATGFRRKFASAGLGLALALSQSAIANPTGPTVRHGNVQVSGDVHTQIQQLTDRAIVDWNSFSIGASESVRFLQPSQLSVILNRVTGADPSTILGRLDANGNVFLINPNGILFGPSSVVNVGGLVASSLNITDQDFLSGNYSFFAESGQDLGAVVNQGKIKISDGGYAVLTGPSVLNDGVIVARSGQVVLASGNQATLNLDGRDLVHFALQGQAGEGTVLLAPGMMSDAISSALGVNPDVRANRLVRGDDGRLRLMNSTLVQAGEIRVDGTDGRDAGSILLDSQDRTILAEGSITSASGAGNNSDGGEILVLSAMDGGTTSLGFTDVQGGSL